MGQNGVGTFQFLDLGAPKNGQVLGASTQGFSIGIRKRVGGPKISTWAGATITINSNPSGPWRSGFGNFLGVNDEINRAVNLIHELGHVARLLYGNTGSQIEFDTDIPDAERINKGNSQRVLDNCFKKKK